jgi:hypothetical protein
VDGEDNNEEPDENDPVSVRSRHVYLCCGLCVAYFVVNLLLYVVW